MEIAYHLPYKRESHSAYTAEWDNFLVMLYNGVCIYLSNASITSEGVSILVPSKAYA